MSDIVERLRNPAMVSRGVPEVGGANLETVLSDTQTRADMNEAAAEIERLRATIQHLRSVAGAVSLDEPTFGQIKKDARG